jgi:hypothetical protein
MFSETILCLHRHVSLPGILVALGWSSWSSPKKKHLDAKIAEIFPEKNVDPAPGQQILVPIIHIYIIICNI